MAQKSTEVDAIEVGKLIQAVETLSKDVDRLSKRLDSLESQLDKGKGLCKSWEDYKYLTGKLAALKQE